MLLLIYGIVFTNWGWTDQPTDIASYRDTLDTSKNLKSKIGSQWHQWINRRTYSCSQNR